MQVDIEVSRGSRDAKISRQSKKRTQTENKRTEAGLRPYIELGPLRRSGLGSGLLDRLVGVARQTGIHLTEFRQLGNMGFINHSGVLRLDLDHLAERLCTKQLFESTGAVLERLLRISGNLCGNSLEPLVRLSKGADSGIEAVLAGSLNLITKPLNVKTSRYLSDPAMRDVACGDSYGMLWCTAQ